MFDWINNITKDSPVFWKNYFSKSTINAPTRFVVFHTEKKELIPKQQFLYSIIAMGVKDNSVYIGDHFDVYISQRTDIENHITEREAIEAFVKYIDNSVLVGYKINSEIEIINKAISKFSYEKIKNETIDIEIMHKKLINSPENSFDLEKLSKIYYIPNSLQKSTSDIVITIALLFIKLKQRLDLI